MDSRNRLTLGWAIANTVLLFAPVVLGIGYFRIWFIPNAALRLPAVACLVLYYAIVISIGKRVSGVHSLSAEWKKANKPTWWRYVVLVAGFVMFALVAYAGFYVTIPGLITSMIGTNVHKTFVLSSLEFDPVINYSRRSIVPHCWYWIHLNNAPLLFDKFCADPKEVNTHWRSGTKLILYGRESILGFRFTKIGS